MLSVVLGAGLSDPLIGGLVRSTELEPRLEHPGPRVGPTRGGALMVGSASGLLNWDETVIVRAG